MNIRVAMANSAKIAFEVSNIHRVESYLCSKREMINSRTKDRIENENKAYQSYKQSNVGLSEAISNEISLLLEHDFYTIESFEQRNNSRPVRIKSRRKA